MKNVFEELFKKSNWAPIDYRDKVVFISDTITFKDNNFKLEVEILNTKSDWEQGVFLKTKGTFYVNNQEISNGIYLWEKTAAKKTSLKIHSKNKELKVWNIWRIENGPMQYGHNGAAMYVMKSEGKHIYYCNDGFPDDDFDDIVFSVSW